MTTNWNVKFLELLHNYERTLFQIEMKSAIITLLAASTQAAEVPCTFTTGAECTTAKEACLQMVTESFNPMEGYEDSAPKNLGGPAGPLAACRNVSECNSIENDN